MTDQRLHPYLVALLVVVTLLATAWLHPALPFLLLVPVLALALVLWSGGIAGR